MQVNSLALGGTGSYQLSASSGIDCSTGPPGAIVMSHFGAVVGSQLIPGWCLLAGWISAETDID